ncbi:MAG: 5-formyltetrahydrofolate cyclo-ligase [Clostridiales bacterium]|nr:5-formyltetrahydrofolate cyclo-ligase [Clostridiales bacterium]
MFISQKFFNKKEIRQLAQNSFEEYTAESLQRESDLDSETLKKLPIYQDAQTICCYASDKTEIPTWDLMECILRDGKKLCLPKIIGRGMMVMQNVSSFNDLVDGKYGLKEPLGDSPFVSKDMIDLCILPCVACSKKGVRVGRGAGYYDRYLKDTAFLKIALCKSSCLYDSILSEKHDIKMDIIISNGEVFYINET